MKKTTIIAALIAAAAAIASCGGKQGTTKIIGTFDGKLPTEVEVTLDSRGIDTLVAVDPAINGFVLELPTDVTSFASVGSEDASVRFIPDGTTIRIHFTNAYEAEVTSDNPKKSVHARYEAFGKEMAGFAAAYREGMRKISLLPEEERAQAEEAFGDSIDNAYIATAKKLYEDNKDNLLSIVAIEALSQDLPVAELLGLAEGVAPNVASTSALQEIKGGLELRLQTAEGQPFKDFTVLQPDGKNVSLSDYVGKGKYVLVDFWASWCGPCKREIPNIKRVYDKYHGDNFDIVSVAVWEQGPQPSIDTAAVYGINWNHIVDAGREPAAIYGIEGIPHLILFGPDGTILKRGLRGHGIEEEVAKYVRPVK